MSSQTSACALTRMRSSCTPHRTTRSLLCRTGMHSNCRARVDIWPSMAETRNVRVRGGGHERGSLLRACGRRSSLCARRARRACRFAGCRGAGPRGLATQHGSIDGPCVSVAPSCQPPRRATQAARLVHPLPCVYVRRALGALGHAREPLPRSGM